MNRRVIKLKKNIPEVETVSSLLLVSEGIYKGEWTDGMVGIGNELLTERLLELTFYKVIEEIGELVVEYEVCVLGEDVPETSENYVLRAKVYKKGTTNVVGAVGFMLPAIKLLADLTQIDSDNAFGEKVSFRPVNIQLAESLLNELKFLWSNEGTPHDCEVRLRNARDYRLVGLYEIPTHIDEIIPMIFNKQKILDEVCHNLSPDIKLFGGTGEKIRQVAAAIRKAIGPNGLPFEAYPELMSSSAFKLLFGKDISFVKEINEELEEGFVIEIDKQFKDYEVIIAPNLFESKIMEQGLRYSYIRICDELYELPYTDISISYSVEKSVWSKRGNYAYNRLFNHKTKPKNLASLISTLDLHTELDEIVSGFNIPRSTPIDYDVTVCKSINEIVSLFFHIKNALSGETISKCALYLDTSYQYVLNLGIAPYLPNCRGL